MADTIADIIGRAEVRHNPATLGNGYILRADIIQIRELLGEELSLEKYSEIINGISFLTQEDKNKLIDDYYSYL